MDIKDEMRVLQNVHPEPQWETGKNDEKKKGWENRREENTKEIGTWLQHTALDTDTQMNGAEGPSGQVY